MQQLKIVKKQLVLDLDKNEAPTAWRWRIDRFVKFDDGSERVVPDEISASAEEVEQHIGAAVGKQAADIESDRRKKEQAIADLSSKAAADIDDLTTRAAAELKEARDSADAAIKERDAKLAAAKRLNEDLSSRLEMAEAKLSSIALADAQYDASVKPLLTAAETRQ